MSATEGRLDTRCVYPALFRAAAVALLALALPTAVGHSDDLSAQPLDPFELQERVAAVNEGELKFLSPNDAGTAHIHITRIRITPESMDTGWVLLDQCHEQIDVVPSAEVVFSAGRIRNLEVTEARGIGNAWIEENTVQLKNVSKDARLCIQAESRALRMTGEGSYRLRNGPFMRRFLDGYYPMKIALEVDYPDDRLRLVHRSPADVVGFAVDSSPGRITADAVFEGVLFTCFDFCDVGYPQCVPAPEACSP